MNRYFILSIAWLWLAAGVLIFALPQVFYDITPGVKLMGPFNNHFIRDVGLAFSASGLCTAYGVTKRKFELVVVSASWPLLHAIFHFFMWLHRGVPIDEIFLFDLVAVIAPAVIVFAFGLKRLTDQSQNTEKGVHRAC
jgi:hypothetical protein